MGERSRLAAVWGNAPAAIARRWGVLLLLLIVLLSLAFRVHLSHECSLWLDEGATRADVNKGWPAVLRGPSREQPPLMFVLVKAATSVFGPGDTSLRAVSLFFGCVLLVAVYELCLMLRLTVARALIVVASLALTHFFIRHSTEARLYSIYPAFVTLATTRTLRLLQGPLRLRDVGGFALSALAAACTHYFALGYVIALLGVIALGVGPSWRSAPRQRRIASGALVLALLVPLGVVVANAAALGRFYAVAKAQGHTQSGIDTSLIQVAFFDFTFLTNETWAYLIEPPLVLIGMALLGWRLRGVAILLPFGLGIAPSLAAALVSAKHFIAVRYLAPSAVWYHIGACLAFFALVDRARLALTSVARARLAAPLPGWALLVLMFGARLREYPDGYSAGIADYRAMQRYFQGYLAADTALVGFKGTFARHLFTQDYPIGSQPINLESFRPVPGIHRYLIVQVHVDDDDPRLERLVRKHFGVSAETWRSLPFIEVPHSMYQSPVRARLVELPLDRVPKPRRAPH